MDQHMAEEAPSPKPARGLRSEGRGKLGKRGEQEGVWGEIRAPVQPAGTGLRPLKMRA